MRRSARLAFFLLAYGSWSGGGPAAQEIGGLESAVSLARERYANLAQLKGADWGRRAVKAAAAQVEFEAARLLNQQVLTGRDSVRGRYRNSPIEDLAGLKEAFPETSRAIHALSLAFVCKGHRFYQSSRATESMGRAEDFLRRAREMTVPLTPFGATPPRIQLDARNAVEWLFRCGDQLPPEAASSLRKTFSALRTEKRSPIWLATDNAPFVAFLAALYFKEARLAERAGREFASILSSAMRADGSLTSDRPRLDILYAAEMLRDAALYDYLTRGTALSLNKETVHRAGRSLIQFAAQAAYEGEPDALALCASSWPKVADTSRVFAAAVWAAAVLLSDNRQLPDALRQEIGALRAAYRERLEESAYTEATPTVLQISHLDAAGPAAETKIPAKGTAYFPAAGYLVSHQNDFFAGVRLPLPDSAGPAAANDARQLGAMNFLTKGLNPNSKLQGLKPRWALPGCTVCDEARPATGLLSAAAVRNTVSLGGVVLGKSGVGAASLVVEGQNVRLKANRSWFIFEDKAATVATGVSATTTDIANAGWAAAPRDRFPHLVIDLGRETLINRIRVYYRVKGGVYFCVPREIIFAVSADGTAWRDMRSITNTPASGTPPTGYVKVNILAVPVRYLRLFFPEGADGETVRMSEVQVFHVERADDDKRLGREVPNLAASRRGARAYASSQANEEETPDKVLSGRGEPGTITLAARTTVLVADPAAGPIVANDGAEKIVRIPEKDKAARLEGVRWFNWGSTGCVFPKPANLVVRNERGEECIVYVDHSGSDACAAVYLPNQTPEETSRAADAGLIEVTMERDVHRIHDKMSEVSACAVFAAQDRGDVIAPEAGCVVYRMEGERFTANATAALARRGLKIRASGVREARINGQPATVQGDFVVK